jgi:23S rRNA (cytosine1962-C5)-methyltransferase
MLGPVLRLKRGRDRPLHHPWIFKGDVADVSDVEPGGVVTVLDSAARFVGRGFYNPRPALCCRLVTRRDEPLDAGFLRARLGMALRRRLEDGRAPEAARLVWSEADGLPGLVVDRYGPVLVVQTLTLAFARRRAEIAGMLQALLDGPPVFAADDPVAAGLEGFEPARDWVGPSGPARVEVGEGAVRLGVTLGGGQKTGLYLDQGDNRRRIGALARGRDVLDAFAYSAGFACHALVSGARRALCIESSPEALGQARENLALNGVAERAELRAANVFDELRRLERARARFGLVVLDPPPFARSRQALEAASRGYKEINLRAMRLLEPGGILATFSCSHHVSDASFEDICREAAADARASFRVVDRLAAAADHPVLLDVPETRYLKGLLLELAAF